MIYTVKSELVGGMHMPEQEVRSSLAHFVFRGHRNGNRSESGACYDDFRNTEEGRDT